jgi:hypothetical protein
MRGGATEVNETQKWATSKKKVENHWFRTLKMEIVCSSETLVPKHQSTRRHDQEDHNLNSSLRSFLRHFSNIIIGTGL